jgi:DNA polymerase IV
MALSLPLTYVLPTHLSVEMLHDLEDQIPTLTYDITEAKLVLGKVTTKQRALFELRTRKLYTEEVVAVKNKDNREEVQDEKAKYDGPAQKRRKIDSTAGKDVTILDSTEPEVEVDSEREYETADEYLQSAQSRDGSNSPAPMLSSRIVPESRSSVATAVDCQPDIEWGDSVKVVKLAWFMECLEVGHLLPFGKYLVYEGMPVERAKEPSPEPRITKVASHLSQIVSSIRALL